MAADTPPPTSNPFSLDTILTSGNQDSSSSSFGDSSSPSPERSNTSQSTIPSPLSKTYQRQDTIPSIKLSDAAALNSSHSPPPLPVPVPDRDAFHPQQPRSVPAQGDGGLSSGTDRSWIIRARSWISSRRWFSNSTSLVALVVSAVGLLFFGWRSYRLEVVSTVNTYVQNCFSQRQSNMTTSPRCDHYLGKFSEGLFEPPYSARVKRNLDQGAAVLMRWGSRGWDYYQRRWSSASSTDPEEDVESHAIFLNSLVAAIATCVVFVVGYLAMIRSVRHARVDGPFTSAARSDLRDIQETGYYNDEPEEVTTGQGYRFIRHIPEKQHYLGHLRQRLRKFRRINSPGDHDQLVWASHNSSADTLVSQAGRRGSVPSKINLRHTNNDDSEEHEGVIELPARGKRRNFFDPNTGEFIHRAPWTQDQEDDSGDEAKKKGETMQAFAYMATGAVAFAGGKNIDDLLLEQLQKTDAGDFELRRRIPQRAGDCLAGLVTNESPTGRPQTV